MSCDKNTSGPFEEARRVVSTLPFLSFLEEVQGTMLQAGLLTHGSVTPGPPSQRMVSASGLGPRARQLQWRVREGISPSSLRSGYEHLELCNGPDSTPARMRRQ
jgi:hypothetical protein